MNSSLRRTVPFVNTFLDDRKPRFQLDEFIFQATKVPNPKLLKRLTTSLDLERVSEALPAETVLELVTEQYEAALDHVFAHPIWRKFRSGDGFVPLLGYVIETRHYLHAASSRMAPGVSICKSDGELTHLLAEHLVEEADHAKYFEAALTRFGCSLPIVQALRPSPTTLEWVYLMRALCSYDPFAAAIVSGFMEFSATDRETVTAWHGMLSRVGLLREDVVEAFFGHVKEDMELEHGSNWRDAIEFCAPISSRDLQFSLNGVSAVAEMLGRWSEALDTGTTGLVIPLLPNISLSDERNSSRSDFTFDGLPVWSAEVLHAVTHGGGSAEKAAQTIGLSFGLSGRAVPKTSNATDLCTQSTRLAERLAVKTSVREMNADPEYMLRKWHTAINAHRLWSELLDGPRDSMVYGWILENYHYLENSPRHTAAAISGCSDPEIRARLVEHLQEEATHGQILGTALSAFPNPVRFQSSRPLPTTLSFLGALRDVGYHDWKAYCLVIAFLQFSLEPGGKRHSEFYAKLKKSSPNCAALITALQHHDEIDQERRHEASIREMLQSLIARQELAFESIRRGAIVAQLAWSFLDGIRCHYRNGELAIAQRVGWFSD